MPESDARSVVRIVMYVRVPSRLPSWILRCGRLRGDLTENELRLIGITHVQTSHLPVLVSQRQHPRHTPSIAFRHIPPNCARFRFSVALRPQKPSGLLGLGSPGRPPRLSPNSLALSLCQDMKGHSINALRKVWVLIRLWKQHGVQART